MLACCTHCTRTHTQCCGFRTPLIGVMVGVVFNYYAQLLIVGVSLPRTVSTIMGSCKSTRRGVVEDHLTSYISGSGEEKAVAVPPLHSGPVHTLCDVSSTHLASAGGDQVCMCDH